jgi:alpha-L-arabinofuranosidase
MTFKHTNLAPVSFLFAPPAWLALAAACMAAEPNLLPNPSFDEGAAGGVTGWKSRAWSGADNARWTVESPGRTGRQCVSIRSERGADAAWTATVPVKRNTFYRLSGWIKTRDMRGAVGALLNIQNMQHVRTSRVTGTRDWTRVATLFWTGETAELEVNCLYGGWGQSTGQAWFDDVALEWVADGTDGRQAIVAVETNTPAVPYSPFLFGGFIEHFHRQIYGGLFEPRSALSDQDGFRKDVIAALRELKLSIVRWPGGCFASGYRWKDGVGRNRQPTYDKVWGVEDPNSFGTDEFVAWCRLVGCEPYICTNAGDGSPEEMRDWVEYCNGMTGVNAQLRLGGRQSEPLHVRYWSIGNENWGGHEIGAKTPAEWGPLVLKSAELMRAADPSLKLLAAATPDQNWTLPLLKAAGKHLDYVAIHEYWLPCWGNNLMPDYLSCIMESEGPETTINRVIGLLEEAGCRGRTRIAFDEWNLRGWHHPGFPRKQRSDNRDPVVADLIRARDKNDLASQYTMADALFTASFLNACLRHAEDVGMANIAPIVNTRGPLYVHPQGLVKRTTFHVLAMYSNRLQARVAEAEVASAPLQTAARSVATLDALATCDATGRKWRIALVNRHPSESLRCLVKLGGRVLEGKFPATILAGDSPGAYNDLERPNRVRPQTVDLVLTGGQAALAPHSITILEIE